jgi:hypothetical protein
LLANTRRRRALPWAAIDPISVTVIVERSTKVPAGHWKELAASASKSADPPAPMSLPRFLLALSLAIATLLACLAPRDSGPAPTIPARELLTLVQKGSGVNCTFDRPTSEALAGVRVPRPPKNASHADLESTLIEAGFRMRPVGPEGNKVFLVERIGS